MIQFRSFIVSLKWLYIRRHKKFHHMYSVVLLGRTHFCERFNDIHNTLCIDSLFTFNITTVKTAFIKPYVIT